MSIQNRLDARQTPRSMRKIQSIVENSARLFVQHGFHKVTMESVSQYANVSKVTLYKYFEDKQALYEHILQENYLKEYNEVVELINSDLPFDQKVRDVVKTRVRKFLDKNVPVYKGEVTLSFEIQKFIKEYQVKMQEHRRALYSQGREEGYICPDVDDKTIDMYFKIVQQGMASVFKDVSDLEDENLDKIFKLLYAGVLGCHN